MSGLVPQTTETACEGERGASVRMADRHQGDQTAEWLVAWNALHTLEAF